MTELPSHLEKMAIRNKHAERHDWREKRENEMRKQWLKAKRRNEGIGGA